MANITAATAAPFIPQIWANTALEVLRANIVLARLVTRDTDVAPFQVGDTLNIPFPGIFVANDKAVNTPVTLQTPTGTTTSVVLNKHKEASFLVEDVARALSNQDVMKRYLDAAVVPIAEQIETDILGLYTGFTYTTGVSGTDITMATIRSTRKLMNDNKAPKGGRIMVVSDKDEIALLGDATLQNYFAFAKPDAIAAGSIGNLAGFDIYQSQLVPAIAGAPVSTKNFAMTPDAIILAMRGLPDAPAGTGAATSVVRDPISGLTIRCVMAYNAAQLGVQITLDVLYGVAKLRNEKAVVVLS
jgi:hypothetical protein